MKTLIIISLLLVACTKPPHDWTKEEIQQIERKTYVMAGCMEALAARRNIKVEEVEEMWVDYCNMIAARYMLQGLIRKNK